MSAALTAAHACVTSKVQIFCLAIGAIGAVMGAAAVVMMVLDRRAAERRRNEVYPGNGEEPLFVGSARPGGWCEPAGWLP